MKKTLLATAIAGALGVSAAAQAATVYSQDGTEVDVYGRIAYGITTGGTDGVVSAEQAEVAGTEGEVLKESGSQFNNIGSRLGFRARHEIDSDLSVFANMEFRFNAAQQNDSAFDSVRSSFVGINSNQFGRLTVGNFNSIYYQAVGSIFDVPENQGWIDPQGTSNSSWGNSVAYSTPVLEGFQAHLQAKHYSGNNIAAGVDGVDASSTTSSQVAASYTWQDLYLAVAYDQNRDFGVRGEDATDGLYGNNVGEGANNGEAVWGAAATYQFTPEFSGRLGYQRQGSDDDQGIESYDIFAVGATFDYGLGEVYGQYARTSFGGEAGSDMDSRNQWMLGANYRFSQPMYVFAEVFDNDFDRDQAVSEINDDLLYTVGVRYDF
ncbi:Outer membrane protein (porin) [Franzmannia pantelleriensis]|uniref:Outer membrane protein (Porin) n=1 Tax=Franzmannia pantelleriensis TaxID=48727 RepID=A0A1G9GSP0_9GAMM|nr:porin [Halomonas pantelleriensis]SDL03687.1 Outer membrane protein (porin) [Halomonas pantelleriensis]